VKSALCFQSNALAVRRKNRELEKHQEKKAASVDEKEKDEVKLHAALELNITFWAIYEPRRDT